MRKEHNGATEHTLVQVLFISCLKGSLTDNEIIHGVPVSITRPPRWPSGKASTLRAEDPGFESRLRRDFFGVESYK